MKKFAILSILALAPMVAFAATTLGNVLEDIGNLIGLATPIIVGLALLAFFVGLVKLIFSAGNEEEKKKSKGIMIWGIIALFVMVSVWGLVNLLGDTFDIDTTDTMRVPTVEDI
ncbi:MAG: hypothetical protein QGG63_02070 [Candidatus Pacebacteria bacterium]|jgi:hypothetical protein|nr:hypothetical protein [Candidatus Paceibacterota bacterium]|tara:strand:+ start:226 stop:567 length:342 start_codon:yes stop_codon:yes gene_type:complete